MTNPTHKGEKVARLLTAFSPTRLSPATVDAHATAWRRAFALRVKARTGEWTHAGFDWHAFSHGFVPAVQGEEARAAYRRRQTPQDFLVLVGPVPTEGFSCRSDVLPWFDRKGIDLYVVAADFSWTMVFTHEGDGCGPYFATREAATGTPANAR